MSSLLTGESEGSLVKKLGGWEDGKGEQVIKVRFEDPMKSMKDEQIIRRRLMIYIFFLLYIYILYISRNEPGSNITKGFPSC